MFLPVLLALACLVSKSPFFLSHRAKGQPSLESRGHPTCGFLGMVWPTMPRVARRSAAAATAVLREVADRSNATNIRARTKELRERRAD